MIVRATSIARRTKYKALKRLGAGEHLRDEEGYRAILEQAEAEARAIGTANLKRKAGISLRPRYKFDTTGITYCVDPDWDS